MDTPTPSATPADCLPGVVQMFDSMNPGPDSDFDLSLAVPESVIELERTDNKEETDAVGEYFLIFLDLSACV